MSYDNTSKIGVFDSGMGGITILHEIAKMMPHEDIIYYADAANCPYGGRSSKVIIKLSKKVVDILLKNGVKIIVIACNTATTNAIKALRIEYPEMRFIGTEPAIKTAVTNSCSGVVGVLATKSTIDSHQIELLTKKFSSGQMVIEQSGDGLVQIIEQGQEDSEDANNLLRKYIEPMLCKGIDNLVLGCTHYPFLTKQIKKITAGHNVRIINPAASIARQTQKILKENNLLTTDIKKGEISFMSSADDTDTYNKRLKKKYVDYISETE